MDGSRNTVGMPTPRPEFARSSSDAVGLLCVGSIKALVDKYGVHFDPKLRDEVVARYDKLNIPTYWHGINVDLQMTKDGVTMSGPGDFTKQRLRYASMYNEELAP